MAGGIEALDSSTPLRCAQNDSRGTGEGGLALGGVGFLLFGGLGVFSFRFGIFVWTWGTHPLKVPGLLVRVPVARFFGAVWSRVPGTAAHPFGSQIRPPDLFCSRGRLGGAGIAATRYPSGGEHGRHGGTDGVSGLLPGFFCPSAWSFVPHRYARERVTVVDPCSPDDAATSTWGAMRSTFLSLLARPVWSTSLSHRPCSGRGVA